MPASQARDRAMALIGRYGLAGFESVKPRALSGGMRQRVAFMRTLALDPKAILLDEPFSALDFQTRLLLQGDVKRIIRDQGKAAILVTHDIGEAIAMSDRVLVLSQRREPSRRSTTLTSETVKILPHCDARQHSMRISTRSGASWTGRQAPWRLASRASDLPLRCHPTAIIASVGFTLCGAVGQRVIGEVGRGGAVRQTKIVSEFAPTHDQAGQI